MILALAATLLVAAAFLAGAPLARRQLGRLAHRGDRRLLNRPARARRPHRHLQRGIAALLRAGQHGLTSMRRSLVRRVRRSLSHAPVRGLVRAVAQHAPLPAWRAAAADELAGWRVGCAVLSLVESGAQVSDASIPELMELSGADLETIFVVLDRLSCDRSTLHRPPARHLGARP